MRSVVFSDERVARELNGRFVSAWLNKKPKSFFAANPEVRVLPPPEGLVLNAVPGYLDVEGFLNEMRMALDLGERLDFRKRRGRQGIALAPSESRD
jgi:hypothetical protein